MFDRKNSNKVTMPPCINDSKIGFPLQFFFFFFYFIFFRKKSLSKGDTIDLHHLSAFQIHVNNLATPTPTSSSNCLYYKGNPPRLMIPANIPYYVFSRNKQIKKIAKQRILQRRDIQNHRHRDTHRKV